MATIAPASPPPRRRIYGWLGIAIVGVVFMALTVAAAPWLFSTAVLRDNILAQIRQMTGLVAVSQGGAVFVVLPQPHISIERIDFADPSGALRIEAKYLKGYLRVTSLLRGRLEIASATLGEPHIAVNLDSGPMPPDSAIGRAALAKSSSPQADSADAARLGVIALIDGSVHVTRHKSRVDYLVDGINVTVDWRQLGSAASIAGSARFRGQSGDIAAVVGRPAELLRGEQSPLSVKIDGPALSFSAEGLLASGQGARFSGRFVAASPSLRKLVETGGYFVDLPAPFQDFGMTADATIGADSASFSGLHLQLDGNAYEGALAIIMGDTKPVLSGTLAADTLSLRPFIANPAPSLERDGQWSHDLFDLDTQAFADVDLRVSAASLTLPGVDLEDAAFSVMSRNDRLDIALIEAKGYKGVLKGRATFTKTNAGLELRASAAASDVDISAAWPNSSEPWRIAGALTATGNIASAGFSVNEMMRNLGGHAQVAIERGEVGGINLDQALRWIDKRPLGVAEDVRYGGTVFDHANFALRIANGVAEIEDGAKLRSRSLDLGFGGVIDLGERTLAVHATATGVAGEQKQDREPAKFDFDVAGPWDEISLVPDARSLIRQSGAAAPLFSPRRADFQDAAPAH